MKAPVPLLHLLLAAVVSVTLLMGGCGQAESSIDAETRPIPDRPPAVPIGPEWTRACYSAEHLVNLADRIHAGESPDEHEVLGVLEELLRRIPEHARGEGPRMLVHIVTSHRVGAAFEVPDETGRAIADVAAMIGHACGMEAAAQDLFGREEVEGLVALLGGS